MELIGVQSIQNTQTKIWRLNQNQFWWNEFASLTTKTIIISLISIIIKYLFIPV